ncbi:MAG: PGPGW domain-containing protein [Actinomycetota bacterium]
MLRRIAEQREKVILQGAEPYLADGETVLHWTRAKQVNGRREGFVYLTPQRCIIHWAGRGEDAPGDFSWASITSWGVVSDAKGGPILGIEAGDSRCFVQLRATTPAMAEAVGTFVKLFAEHAPEPQSEITGGDHIGLFEPTASPEVTLHPMTIGDQARRIIVTLLGLTLIVGAILIIPLPGPWSFIVTIAGLAILASEYDLAKDALAWTKQKYQQASAKLKARRGST